MLLIFSVGGCLGSPYDFSISFVYLSFVLHNLFHFQSCVLWEPSYILYIPDTQLMNRWHILSVSLLCPFPVPGKPLNVVAIPNSSSTIRVQWEGPPNEVNVDGYIIRCRPVTCEGEDVREVEVMSPDTTVEYVVEGLEEGTDYNISVAAVNSIGTGKFSTPETTVYTFEEGIYLPGFTTPMKQCYNDQLN